MAKVEAFHQAVASCSAAIITFIGICQEFVGCRKVDVDYDIPGAVRMCDGPFIES